VEACWGLSDDSHGQVKPAYNKSKGTYIFFSVSAMFLFNVVTSYKNNFSSILITLFEQCSRM